MTKKRTKAEDEESAKRLNELTGIMMMNSAEANSYILCYLHLNSYFGKNDMGENISMDTTVSVEVMEKVTKQVISGDLSNLEKMLVCQAYSLEQLFVTMASKISGTTISNHIDLYARFALKAQNQCRSTIATLSEMKNPKRSTFIKQQNNAVNQQINQNKKSKKSKKLEDSANELLEKTDGERLDTGTKKETIGANQDMETVGEVNRS